MEQFLKLYGSTASDNGPLNGNKALETNSLQDLWSKADSELMSIEGTKENTGKKAASMLNSDLAKGLMGKIAGGDSKAPEGVADALSVGTATASAFGGVAGIATGAATSAGTTAAATGALGGNPYMAAAMAVKDNALEIGKGLGGEQGGIIAESIFNPMSAMNDENLNISEKILSSSPISSPILRAIIRTQALKRTKRKESRENAQKSLDADKLASAELKNQYNQSQGLESITSLENLRQKNL